MDIQMVSVYARLEKCLRARRYLIAVEGTFLPKGDYLITAREIGLRLN